MPAPLSGGSGLPDRNNQHWQRLKIWVDDFWRPLRYELKGEPEGHHIDLRRLPMAKVHLPDVGHKAIAYALRIVSIALKLSLERPFLEHCADCEHGDEER